jgi:hypothetical protein
MADCTAEPRRRSRWAIATPAAINNVDCSSQLTAKPAVPAAVSNKPIFN